MAYKTKEQEREYQRKYRRENRERLNAYKREWKRKNRTTLKVKRKDYRERNREKIRKQTRAYYLENRDLIHQRKQERQFQYLLEWIEIIEDEGRRFECKYCGYNENASAIEFHHRNPEEKEKKLSYWTNQKPTPERIKLLKEEIRKCDIVCSIHHKEIHNPQRRIRRKK